VEDEQRRRYWILKLWEEKSMEEDFWWKTPLKSLSMAARQFDGWKSP
jgi:hypothetical protein